jgi:hypothetical protein
MNKAKAFLFICAGIFLLALAYHLGARSAGAQAPGGVECATVSWEGSSMQYAVINRYLYRRDSNGVALCATDPIPGGSRAVGCGGNGNPVVILEDGSVYWWANQCGLPGVWLLGGQFPTGATPAQSISIGQLKAKYAK